MELKFHRNPQTVKDSLSQQEIWFLEVYRYYSYLFFQFWTSLYEIFYFLFDFGAQSYKSWAPISEILIPNRKRNKTS